MIYDNISPLLKGVDPTLNDEIAGRFTAIAGLLQPYEQGDTFVSYDQLDDADRNQLKAALAALSEDLAQVAGAFGLEVK